MRDPRRLPLCLHRRRSGLTFGAAALCRSRLGTVAAYSRVIVLDAGEVAEIDTPLALFDRPDSIFRGSACPSCRVPWRRPSTDPAHPFAPAVCDKAALSREDIVRIRAEGSA